MSLPSAAIFDLDGVIVDTAPLHFNAWRHTAAELGFELDAATGEGLKGVGRGDALEIVLRSGGIDPSTVDAGRLADQKNDRYVKSLESISTADLLPGALQLLTDLREAGVPVALASASRNALTILERLGIVGLFDAIVDGNQILRTKPDPEVFLLAAELLGVDAAKCVVFEDADAGVAAATAAGMRVVGIGLPGTLLAADAVVPDLAHVTETPAALLPDLNALHGVHLDRAPFHLDDEAQQWVRSTLASLNGDRRVGQLFCLLADPDTTTQADADFAVAEPGGYMRRPSMSHDVVSFNTYLQSKADVPLLIAANLEAGPHGVAFDQTSMGSPLQAAATGDAESARRIGEVCAVQGRAMGVNWAFSPIVDIQLNWRNPIVLTRGFGSNASVVADMGEAFVKGLQDNGVAASVKHWPGDGVDDRDQHLVTTVNTLSTDEWDSSFGAVYRRMIEADALTIMAAHIALPSYSRALRPGIADDDILPASLAPEITTELLRDRLGFAGVVVTDASLMAGMQMSMPRAQAVPQSIAAGCDMFLFTEDYATDLEHLRAGIAAGIVSTARLNEAVTRVLALKAALGLHHASTQADLVPDSLAQVNRGQHEGWAAEQAARAITLVKSEEGLLPLSVSERPRVLLYSLRGGPMPSTGPAEKFRDALNERGFTATLHVDPPREETMFRPVGQAGAVTGAELFEGYDAVIYVADIQPSSNFHTARPDWTFWTAANLPRFTHSIPTLFVSLGNPYHLQDVPRVKTYVNAYAANDATVEAVVNCLTGAAPFLGTSPVDPFCDYWDARLT
ncbi:beta-phosphoglucomutase [Demequina oxidasica]|uniref:beta-phosphoglucomutase n=1 Tax=Demequina oxidasica TaxID=676199 RepID=UPI0007816CA3|nr:beta-phosphoglucomutase [Demequina oxidasica]